MIYVNKCCHFYYRRKCSLVYLLNELQNQKVWFQCFFVLFVLCFFPMMANVNNGFPKIDYTCIILLNDLKHGLLHSFICHWNQWSFYIPTIRILVNGLLFNSLQAELEETKKIVK